MSTPNEKLELLLADAGSLAPTLADGLSAQALAPDLLRDARFQDSEFGEREMLLSFGDVGDSNDLRYQRWGVVVPEGPEGYRLLEIIRPLIELREREQGEPVRIYRVPPGLNIEASLHWRESVLHEERYMDSPRYFFVVGGADSISFDLQEVLSESAFVGRFDAATDSGYEAYVEKVCRAAQTSLSDQSTRIVFHIVRDGTAAVTMAQRNLMAPCQDSIIRSIDAGDLRTKTEILRADDAIGVDDFMHIARLAVPSILLSAGHSLGAPKEGWASELEQRARQGNLVLRNQVLSAEDVANGPFYPDGIWINLASFSAATPEQSTYAQLLGDIGDRGTVQGTSNDRILANLPKSADRAFLAALPIAALTNPKGPLAVIGKKDLAWMYTPLETQRRRRDVSTAISQALQRLVLGNRIGMVLDEFARMGREANDDLTTMFDKHERQLRRNEFEPVDVARRAFLWLLRNDLRSYMLLGDPAVRLPGNRSRGA